MWAMIPMLRTLARSVSTSSATVALFLVVMSRVGWPAPRRYAGRGGSPLPAVVREGPVGLGHLVGVLAALDSGAQAVARVEDLVHEALGHRPRTGRTRVVGGPAQRQLGRAGRTHFDRDQVGRTADATGPHLEGGSHVVQRPLEHLRGVLLRLAPHALERVVDAALGDGLLAVE